MHTLFGIRSRLFPLLVLLLVITLLDKCLAFVTSFVPQQYVTRHYYSTNDAVGMNNCNTRKHGGLLLHNCKPFMHQILLFSNTQESDDISSDSGSGSIEGTELSKEEKLKSFQQDIREKFTQERSYNTFGILSPIAKTLDEVSGDWALSYADLRPATPRTIEGQAFLATNVGYAVAGLILGVQGDWFFAFLTELAGIVSFWYHYSQLEFGQNREEVRLALLTDYFTAGAALITGGFYMVEMGISGVPLDALITGGAAVVCLSLCWVWEVSFSFILL